MSFLVSMMCYPMQAPPSLGRAGGDVTPRLGRDITADMEDLWRRGPLGSEAGSQPGAEGEFESDGWAGEEEDFYDSDGVLI